MATFLFCSAPLWGHLDFGGYLDAAAHLASSGNKVVWASGDEVRGAIEASGVIHFEASALTLPPQPLTGRWTSRDDELEERALRSIALWLDERKVIAAATRMTQLAHALNPDLIVAESCVPSAALMAESVGVPMVVVGYPHGAVRRIPDRPRFHALLGLYRRRLNAIRDELSLRLLEPAGDRWMYYVSNLLHLSFFPWYWWYDDESSIPPQARCLGGRSTSTSSEPLAYGPLVFSTMGTVYLDDTRLLCLLLGAMAKLPRLKCVISCPINRLPSTDLPPNVYWTQWADYEALFPLTSLVVHHGGMGTTHAAIRHGIPQIAVPFAPDQPFHASRIEALGVGRQIRLDDLTVEVLAHTIQEVMKDRTVAERARALRNRFAAEGGIAYAAELLLQAAAGRLPEVSENRIPAIAVFPHDYS